MIGFHRPTSACVQHPENYHIMKKLKDFFLELVQLECTWSSFQDFAHLIPEAQHSKDHQSEPDEVVGGSKFHNIFRRQSSTKKKKRRKEKRNPIFTYTVFLRFTFPLR